MQLIYTKPLHCLSATLLLICAIARADTAPQLAPMNEAMQARSVVSGTDFSRLHDVFDKAERGEKITVAVIGGSITAGAKATKNENRYADRVAQWWRKTFPKSDVVFVNAGVGATGSGYAALRAQRDLLSQKPDFVIVEFGVNDGDTREFAETYEGLLRQILRQPQNPAVLLLFMKYRGGGNAQQWQSRLGRYYALPMVSFRDAVQPEIDAKTLSEDDVMADEVHPNDRGHQLTAEFITHYLEDARKNRDKSASGVLPPPMLSDRFERVHFYDGANLQPTKNVGWLFDKPSGSWIATVPGSVLECEIAGELIETVSFRIKGPMGRARVQVDDLPPVVLEGWFDATWGGFLPVDVIARDLKAGSHRVRIELLSEKATESTGHEFRLFGIGAAGLAP